MFEHMKQVTQRKAVCSNFSLLGLQVTNGVIDTCPGINFVLDQNHPCSQVILSPGVACAIIAHSAARNTRILSARVVDVEFSSKYDKK